MTYEAWINPSKVTGHNMVVTKEWCTGNQYSYYLTVLNGKLRWVWNATGNCGNGSEVYETTSAVITPNEWQHIAVVHTTTSVKMYLNGVLVSGALRAGDSYSSIKLTTQSIRVGTYRNGNGSCGLHFTGGIDDVRLWNDARTGSEISGNMNNELSGNEANLAGYWKFNEGTGTAVADASHINIGKCRGAF